MSYVQLMTSQRSRKINTEVQVVGALCADLSSHLDRQVSCDHIAGPDVAHDEVRHPAVNMKSLASGPRDSAGMTRHKPHRHD